MYINVCVCLTQIHTSFLALCSGCRLPRTSLWLPQHSPLRGIQALAKTLIPHSSQLISRSRCTRQRAREVHQACPQNKQVPLDLECNSVRPGLICNGSHLSWKNAHNSGVSSQCSRELQSSPSEAYSALHGENGSPLWALLHMAGRQ